MGHALAESRSFVIRQLGKKYLRLGYRRIKFPPQPEDTTAIKNRLFFIQIEFSSATLRAFEYDPSQIVVQLPDGRIVKAKALPCPGTLMDRSYLLLAPPIIGLQRLDKIDCFKLFFDTSPPRIDEVFIMTLGSLRREQMQVELPPIVFRKEMTVSGLHR